MFFKYFKYFMKVKFICLLEKMVNGVISIVILDCIFGLIFIVINSLKVVWGFRVCNFFFKVINYCGVKWIFFNKIYLEKNKRKKCSVFMNFVKYRFGLNIGISKVKVMKSCIWVFEIYKEVFYFGFK